MRSSPALLATALLASAFASTAAHADPASFTEQCQESTGMLTVWSGTTSGGDYYGVKSVELGHVVKHSVGITSANEDCLNPQTGDAGLNPQTGDAGIDADVMGDLVVLNVNESGQPIAIIAVFESGVVHLNMEEATVAEAHAILEEEGKLDAAATIHHLLPEGALKTAFATLF